MEISQLLPKNKMDNSNFSKIKSLSDDDLSKIAKDLLEWLQDANYPIFEEVLEIIVLRQNLFVGEISKVLKTDDLMWKYWILTHLFPKLSQENILALQSDLDLIINTKSNDAEEEELLELAKLYKLKK